MTAVRKVDDMNVMVHDLEKIMDRGYSVASFRADREPLAVVVLFNTIERSFIEMGLTESDYNAALTAKATIGGGILLLGDGGWHKPNPYWKLMSTVAQVPNTRTLLGTECGGYRNGWLAVVGNPIATVATLFGKDGIYFSKANEVLQSITAGYRQAQRDLPPLPANIHREGECFVIKDQPLP